VVSATRANFYTTEGHVSRRRVRLIAYTLNDAYQVGHLTDLAGWQLDKLAENPQKQAEDVEDSGSDEDVPFACLICRKHFTNPVATRCGHYFCSACAIKRFAKTPKCLACGAPTNGIFNRADKILAKMTKKKAKKTGGDMGEDDEGLDRGDGGVTIEGLSEADSGGEGN